MGETTTPAPAVPGFELGRLIAGGATSEVWEGVCRADGRRVAVKVAHAEHEAVEAAAREASLSGRAASAHVVPVEASLPLADGRVALVMPLLRGGSLGALVAARGHLAPGEVVTVLAPVAGALGRLHALGVVHGDVSPGNILLDLDGRPLLADLGLGRVVGEEPAAVWGTEGYLAPEVLMGEGPSAPADVYALGAVGWLCLTGSAPGPPGLRAPLVEASRAGAEARELVEVLESAVAPRAADRPDATSLGWALFGAAKALPLHLVHGDDTASAVTFRLRAAAGTDGDEAPRGQGRHARPRRIAPVVRRAGLLAVGVAVLTAGALVVASGAGGDPARTPPATERAPGSARGVPSSDGPPPAGPSATSDVRADPAAPERAPGALVVALAEARAAAWRAADPARLDGAEAPGSPAHADDLAGVTALVRAGLRYRGLRHTVDAVETVSAGTASAVLRARVGTTAYEVVGSGAPARRPAEPGTTVLLRLTWTDEGWRVADLQPAR